MDCNVLFTQEAAILTTSTKKEFTEDFRLAVLKYIKSREGTDQILLPDKDVKVWYGALQDEIIKSDSHGSIELGVTPDDEIEDSFILRVRGWTVEKPIRNDDQHRSDSRKELRENIRLQFNLLDGILKSHEDAIDHLQKELRKYKNES